jgi:hypothetical protein
MAILGRGKGHPSQSGTVDLPVRRHARAKAVRYCLANTWILVKLMHDAIR